MSLNSRKLPHFLTQFPVTWALAVVPLLVAAPTVAQMDHKEHHHQDAGAVAAPDYAPSKAPSPFNQRIIITRSDGAVVDLASLRGRPTIMTMFFTSCPDVCPMMTENILHAIGKIPAGERKDLQVVFVSFDDRDKPAILENYRKAHAITSPHWTLATASPQASQQLGDILGVRFRKLPDGSFSHSAMVDLIAADETIMARVPGTSLTDPQFPMAIRAMLSMPSAPGAARKKL